MSVNLQAKGLKVRSLDLSFHEVSWRIVDTVEDVLDYTFQVLRSESPSGPFEALSQPFEDRYFLIDNIIQTAHRWRTYFYVLRVTHKLTGDFLDSEPVTKEPDPDLIALELRRHMQLLFREFAGRRIWALPVRTFGQRCECWSVRLQKRTRSGCILCFDTGFVRGYLSPIEIWGQVDPSPKTEQNTTVGALHQSNTTGRFGAYPPLKPDDLLIEPENRRWRVIQVNQTEQLRARVHQEVQLHEIPQRDVEFAIPLNMATALKDLWLTPARNYTNPHNLEAFENEEIPGIFSLYQTTYPGTR
jgi:hypothetical protein